MAHLNSEVIQGVWIPLIMMDEPQKKIERDSLALARSFFSDPKLSVNRVEKLSIMSISEAAKHFGIPIVVYEPIVDRVTDEQVWHLIGSCNVEDEEEARKIEIQNGHCFYIISLGDLAKFYKCNSGGQKSNRKDNFHTHVRKGCSPGTTLVCNGERVRDVK